MRNLSSMLKGDPEGKLYKFLTFAGSDRDIADPWYTGDFDTTYNDIVERGCEGFLKYLKKRMKKYNGEAGSIAGSASFFFIPVIIKVDAEMQTNYITGGKGL